MSQMMICPKWRECQSTVCMRSRKPHVKEDCCDDTTHVCPRCVPITGEHEDLLLGMTNAK